MADMDQSELEESSSLVSFCSLVSHRGVSALSLIVRLGFVFTVA